MAQEQDKERAQPVAWRHSRTHCLYETREEVELADGDAFAEPLYAAPQPNAALADGWISVDEGLPETSRVVLACNDRGAMHHAQYLNGNWFHIWHPTHWREMPAPPTLNACKGDGNV